MISCFNLEEKEEEEKEDEETEKEEEKEEEEEEFVETLLHLMYEYVVENPRLITEPDFHETFEEDVKQFVDVMLENQDPNKIYSFFTPNKEDVESLEKGQEDELVDATMALFFDTIYPRRSHPDTFPSEITTIEKERIRTTIERLTNMPQPKQRTAEWYEFRGKLITASNAYKAFESPSQQNQLIYEKCQPFQKDADATTDAFKSQVNVHTTLHWGQKYEPLSVLLYEDEYKTRVGDFGCIQHPTYSFIGASPDGINVDPEGTRYGRLLEIKNIVNREIDGVPKKEYWVQMQLQMETCDLDACDFLETRFQEYKSEEDTSEATVSGATASEAKSGLTEEQMFLFDGDDFRFTERGERKGVILYFANGEGNPVYVYTPFDIDTYKKFVLWEIGMIQQKTGEGLTWIKNLYWRLDEFSCVLVERNKLWFESNVSGLAAIWDTILKERETGYEHRAPQKRPPSAKSAPSSSASSALPSWFINKPFH